MKPLDTAACRDAALIVLAFVLTFLACLATWLIAAWIGG